MKPSAKINACMVFIIALLAVSYGSPQTTKSETAAVENEPAAPEKELIGVWEIIGTRIEFPPDMNRKTLNVPHLPGIVIFTKKYFSWVDFHHRSYQFPELPEEPTDAQVAAVYNQLTAVAGTYELEGSSIKRHRIVTKNPNQMGSDNDDWTFAFEGDILTMSVTRPNQIYTLKLRRLE